MNSAIWKIRAQVSLTFILYTSTFFLAAPVRAEEFTQTSHLSARLFSGGTLVLDTRVGDIFIDGWDEPHVKIEVEKVVRAGNETKAKPLYDQIQVRLEGADKEVRLFTVYPSRKLWRPFRGESKLTANLRIKMPFDSNLKLKCVDGDVRISGLAGSLRLHVNYGDVEIDVPHLYSLRSLYAHTMLGYVQSDLQGLSQDSAGIGEKVSFWNSQGQQDIEVKVRLGGVFIYREAD